MFFSNSRLNFYYGLYLSYLLLFLLGGCIFILGGSGAEEGAEEGKEMPNVVTNFIL